MPRIEAQFRALTERQQTTGQRRLAIDPDKRFGTDQVACRAEQRMPALHGPHLNAVHPVDGPPQQRRIDQLDSSPVGAKALGTDDQRERDCIDAKDKRPFLRDDVKQGFDTVRLEALKHRLVDRCDCA